MNKILKLAMLGVCLLLLPIQVFAHEHHEEAPAQKIEQPISKESTLQKLIDATKPGGTLLLEGRTYRGSVTISKPITIRGTEGTKIASLATAIAISNTNNVIIEDITIQADEVGIVGEKVDSLQLKNVTMKQGKASIQLTSSANIELENVDITGKDGHFSTKGHAIAIYKSKNVHAFNCEIELVLDGFYVENVAGITLENNEVKESRYAVHLMYSDNVKLRENKVASNMTGFMIMVAENVEAISNEVVQHNSLNSLGVYLYDVESVLFAQNKVDENTVAMSIENARKMEIFDNAFSANGTVIQAKRSKTLHIHDNQFVGNILTIRTDRDGAVLIHNFYDDYDGKDYDGDGIGDTKYIATNSFGQWMVRKPVYQYFIESPSVVTLNLMDTEVIDEKSTISIDEKPIVMKSSTGLSVDVNGWQLSGSLLALIAILYVRRKLK